MTKFALFFIFGILALGACAPNPSTITGVIDKGAAIRADAPKYNVGDEWTFKHVQRGVYTVKVIALEKNNIVTTQSDMGFREYRDENFTINKIEGDVSSRLATGSKLLDFPLFVGKSWNYPIQTPNFRGEADVRIVRYEQIATPAGPFDTFKFEAKWFDQNKRPSGGFQYWYAPSVKEVISLMDENKKWDREIVSFSLK